MSSPHPFISFGVNAEDVVLHRALGEVTDGRYVEVGAHDPAGTSATRAFRDRGWTGIVVGPDAEPGTALEETLRPDDDIHFMVIGEAGRARAVLSASDLGRWRPWVLVVAATAPDSAQQTHEEWEHLVLDAGYEFCLFDGVSRFYVAAEHADRLRPALSYPANVRDDFVPHRCHELERELSAARDEVDRWRGEVLARWSDVVGTSTGTSAGSTGRGSHEVVRLKEELDAMRATVSWRITAPLRAVQRQRLREWR